MGWRLDQETGFPSKNVCFFRNLRIFGFELLQVGFRVLGLPCQKDYRMMWGVVGKTNVDQSIRQPASNPQRLQLYFNVFMIRLKP